MFWQFKGIPEHFSDIVHMNLTLLINITFFFSDAETKVLKYGGFKRLIQCPTQPVEMFSMQRHSEFMEQDQREFLV